MTETRDKNRYTYCMFEASYTVAHMKKSKVWDDGLYLHDESRILPTFYPLSLSTCKRISNSEFQLIIKQPSLRLSAISWETNIDRQISHQRSTIKAGFA